MSRAFNLFTGLDILHNEGITQHKIMSLSFLLILIFRCLFNSKLHLSFSIQNTHGIFVYKFIFSNHLITFCLFLNLALAVGGGIYKYVKKILSVFLSNCGVFCSCCLFFQLHLFLSVFLLLTFASSSNYCTFF